GMSRVDRMQLVKILQADLVLLAVCLGEVIEPSVEQNARAVVEQHALAIMRREGL
ncbi:uncharacterized protein METZ01_LOCUS453001, partial [marine metagenome]